MSSDLHDLKRGFDCRVYGRMMLGQPKRSTPRRDTYFAPHRDDGHKASFVVSHDGFKDWGGDGKSGSILDLIMLLENLTLPQAIERLQDLIGNRPVYFQPRPRVERPAASAAPSVVWQNAAINFIEYAQRELWRNEAVLNYLRHERLLSDETIRAAGLGWNPRAHKVAGQYWIERGIVIPRYQDGALRLVNVRTVTGSFAAFLGVDEDKRFDGSKLDKYLCMAGSKLIGSFYSLSEPRAGIPTLIVEGELDCILAQQEFGNRVNVLTLGGATNRITPEWTARLVALDAPIYIALDNDGAGQDATKHLIGELGERATAIKYPAGYKDFTDCLNAGMIADQWLDKQTSLYIHADGVPASWVSGAKTYMEEGVAFILVQIQDAARKGVLDPLRFERHTLHQWGHENGYPISPATHWRYMQAAERAGLISKCNTLSLYPTEIKASMSQNEINLGGRPAVAYSLAKLSHFRATLLTQAKSRLHDHEYKTDGKTGTKARPTETGLIRLGLPAAIAPQLDKAYESIYRRQSWAYRYAEKRIAQKHAALLIELSDLTPLKTAGYLIKRQSDLEPCLVQSFLKEDVPTSQKEIAGKIGKNRSHVGKVMARMGYQGYQPDKKIIPIKKGFKIKEAALEAVPHGRWIGLLIDDNPDLQPFEQSVANQATKSIAMVIQPPNAYKYVGVEWIEKPAPRQKKIDMKQSKAAPEYKPSPYFGDDVNPEIDYNQNVLGLHLVGWSYEQDTGFWIHPDNENVCRTLQDAILMQAGEPIEALPIVDAAPVHVEIREISAAPSVESLPSIETPPIAYFSSRMIDYRAMNRAGRAVNPFSADYDPDKVIYEDEYEITTD